MSAPENLLFAYGPLMHGEARASALSGRRFLGGASTPGALLDSGTAPCLDPGGAGRVHGELYAITDEDLRRIDDAEGVSYRRERIQVRPGSDGPPVAAWSYVRASPGGAIAPTLDGGRWGGAGRRFRGGTIWYFAYASNLWRMAERRKLEVIEQQRARIDNYLIASVTDSGDGKNAYGHILPRRGATVEGMAYRLYEEQVASDFDVQEKVGIRMQRRTFSAETAAGRVFTEVYIALPAKMVWGRPQHPDNAVKILDGARDCQLPSDYLDFLAAFLPKPADPADYDDRHAW